MQKCWAQDPISGWAKSSWFECQYGPYNQLGSLKNNQRARQRDVFTDQYAGLYRYMFIWPIFAGVDEELVWGGMLEYFSYWTQSTCICHIWIMETFVFLKQTL